MHLNPLLDSGRPFALKVTWLWTLKGPSDNIYFEQGRVYSWLICSYYPFFLKEQTRNSVRAEPSLTLLKSEKVINT